MKKNEILYSQAQKRAIEALKGFIPKSNNEVINIIETILNCYLDIEAVIRKEPQTDQSEEVDFLIEQLSSIVKGLKNKIKALE